MSIEFEGLEELQERFKKLGDAATIEAAMGKACALVEREAKQKAPTLSGELRRSISSKIEGAGETIQGIVFTPTSYAPYVEYGTGLFAEGGGRSDVPWSYQDAKGEWHSTSGQHPQPFMRPALDENRDQIIELLSEGLKDD